MPLVEWNDTFSVGVKTIDEEHKKFVSLVNLLHDAMEHDKDREVVGNVLKELQLYVIYHFRTEESWMKVYRYPDIDKHKREHQEAIQKVERFVMENERNQQTVVIELMEFMTNWLLNHILKEDRKYIPYFQNKV